MLNKILIFLLAISGIGFGYLLALIAKEELLAGRKYFFILKKALFTGLFLVFFYYSLWEKNLFLFLSLFLIFLLIYFLNLEFGWEAANYLIIALVYFIVIQNPKFLPLIGSLIFLNGLVSGTLWKARRFKG